MTKNQTSFKPGNQAAKGCETSGRPRTVSFPPEEMIKLGQEMVEWVKENKPLHLSEWYTQQKHFTHKQWETMKECAEILPYYDEAMSYVRKNYIDGTVPPAIAHRFLWIYFSDLKREEKEKMEFEAKLKSANEQLVDPEFKKKFDDLMQMYQKAQTKPDPS